MYQGKLIKDTLLSNIFDGTTRDYYLYIPQQYSDDKPANLMVFQDGFSYIDENKPMNIPVVIDKLIEQKVIPVTICLFVNPGVVITPTTAAHHPDSQRSFEYDSMSDQYTRFMIEELLPVALQDYNVTTRAEQRAIVGFSSGGICAWTVAWYRPELFGNVLSHCGSFVDIRGGGKYPYLIRNQAKKPIRMFFQSGSNDYDTKYGSWALGNKQMVAALQFKGYDYHFEFGEEGHNLIHGAELIEQSIKWLFKK
jgi:enterochelin esterase family protein